MNRDQCLGLIWVCQCCMLVHANGECCADDEGHDKEPWALIEGKDHTVTMGLLAKEHHEECEVFKTGGYPVNYECDCAENTFSTSQCEGCGTYMHGERHAFTLWEG